MFDTQAYKELFETQEETQHPWSRGMTEQQLVDRVFSKSYLTEQYLNGEAKVEFEKELRSIIQDKEKTWIDQEVSLFAGDTLAETLRKVSLNTSTIVMSSSAARRLDDCVLIHVDNTVEVETIILKKSAFRGSNAGPTDDCSLQSATLPLS